jgi:hypothetical protein
MVEREDVAWLTVTRLKNLSKCSNFAALRKIETFAFITAIKYSNSQQDWTVQQKMRPGVGGWMQAITRDRNLSCALRCDHAFVPFLTDKYQVPFRRLPWQRVDQARNRVWPDAISGRNNTGRFNGGM